ncbi:MAG: NUDIX hydrolase [Balneolaceae bacterium]|nr:NUDIX hydrolase [Balneolaceae bacterium]
MKDKELQFGRELKKLEEKKLSSKKVFEGNLLHIFVDDVLLPDKTTSGREWIEHPGACAVVPVFEDGTIMLIKQFRYAPKKIFIEVPAGKIDKGEPPQRTAERELLEECGVTCRHLQKAGQFYPAIGYSDEIIHVYVGWGLEMQEKNSDDDEFLVNYRVPFLKALDLIKQGEIDDGKTISALLQARLWWMENEPFKVDLDD